MILIYVILSNIFIHSIYCLVICPPISVDISPCKCFDRNEQTAIACFGGQALDLVNIFEILDANISPHNRHFDVFYLNNTAIEEIPENVFKNFKFNEIYFHNTVRLQAIHSKAFGQSDNDTKQLHVWDTGLDISSDNSTKINTFNCLKNLDYIDFSTSECPASNLFGPNCKCEKEDKFLGYDLNEQKLPVISCKNVSNNSELIQTFQRLGSSLLRQRKNFLRFVLKDSDIEQLPEDVFNGVIFSMIVIENCPKLSSIDRNVFKSIQPFINQLSIIDINLRNNSDNTADLWHVISSLENLINLRLVNVFHEIPSKAFKIIDSKSQLRLRLFSHSGFATESTGGARIKSIGSFAFYFLPNIEVIDLQDNLLERISKYSFANQESSDRKLTIQLSKNILTPKSFSCGSLLGSRRPVRLELGQPFIGCNREINFLEESVFAGFLDRDGNELDIGCSFTMDCDCRMKWLYDSPNHWRDRIKCGPFGDISVPCEVDNESDDEYMETVSLWDLPHDYFKVIHQCDGEIMSNKSETISEQNSLEKLFDDVMPFIG